MDTESEDNILEIIETYNISKFDDLLCKYPNDWIVEVALSSWILDSDKVIHIIKNYRDSDMSDSWIMNTCAFDIETYILEAMHKEGINLQASYQDNDGQTTNFFTQMCQTRIGQNKSSYIMMDNMIYLHKSGHQYIGKYDVYLNNEAKRLLKLQ